MTTKYTPPEVESPARRQFMTELEAAHAREAGKRRWTMPRNTALDQSMRVRVLVERCVAALERTTRKANRLGHVWSPTLEEVRAIREAVAATKLALEVECMTRDFLAKERGKYTDEELAVAWSENLVRTTPNWTEKEWWPALRQTFGDEFARVAVRLQFGEDALASVEGS